MYDERVQYALDNFIEDGYFYNPNGTYHLKEEKDSGKSDLLVHVAERNICLGDFDDKRKCAFVREERKYGMKKSADHILFTECSQGWVLHIIEMKKSVGYKTWLENIRPKMRSSYLNALALAQFLGITVVSAVTYTTYESEAFDKPENTTDIKTFVPLLGKPAYDSKKEEWDKDRIQLNFGKSVLFEHKKILMVRNDSTNTLEGELSI
jgi:hypothetical protein